MRALAQVVTCDIHPINNISVLKYLEKELKVGTDKKTALYRHWIAIRFAALEVMLADDPRTDLYCHGDTPGLADLCFVPQVYNARRFECDLAPYPTVVRIDAACARLTSFIRAAPEASPMLINKYLKPLSLVHGLQRVFWR